MCSVVIITIILLLYVYLIQSCVCVQRRVFFFSIHLYDKDSNYEFYPGSGQSDIMSDNVMNQPIIPTWRNKASNSSVGPAMKFSGREDLRQAIDMRLIPALRAHSPDLILLSAGFDGAAGDIGNTRNPTR